MDHDSPPSTSTATVSVTRQATPYVVSSHQRGSHLFAGLRGEDVEDWVDDYERVPLITGTTLSSSAMSPSYLTGVAKTWFFNHEVDLTDWPTFKEHFCQVFGTPVVRLTVAMKTLDTCEQQPGESYTSYIEDVLALCCCVSASMPESDKVRHIIKGIQTAAFNAQAVKNPAPTAGIIATCQRLDELESVRLQSDDGE